MAKILLTLFELKFIRNSKVLSDIVSTRGRST